MVKRFDLVRLKSTRRVGYVNGPASRPADPKGNWVVVAGISGKDMLLLAKERTIIIIPEEDVERVAEYNIENAINMMKRIKNKDDLSKIRGVNLNG